MTTATDIYSLDPTFILFNVGMDLAGDMAAALKVSRDQSADRPLVVANQEMGFFAVLVDIDEYNLLRATCEFLESESAVTEIEGKVEFEPWQLSTLSETLNEL